MDKIRVAVVMGGYSNECAVSCKSGKFIYESLDSNRYDVHRVLIEKQGWFYLTHDDTKIPIDRGDFSVTFNDSRKLHFDICYNTVHGIPGENGVLQAYWDMVGQPYTGCGFYLSALAMNKKDALAVLAKYGLPMAKNICLQKGQAVNNQKIVDQLGLPLFVKPNQSGSSLGVTKVKNIEELPSAIQVAFAEGDEILLEAFLDGTQISVGLFKHEEKTTVLGITEIISENQFFDYEAKYLGASEQITPARLDQQTTERVQQTAKRAYDCLNFQSFCRIDFIVVGGTPFLLEMNTNPGFTAASIFPQQARHFGISIQELCGREIERCLAKWPCRVPQEDELGKSEKKERISTSNSTVCEEITDHCGCTYTNQL